MSARRLEELQRRREFECRLTPDRALGTLDDAHAFLSDRGMLTRMSDSALPSLFGACHEEPARAGGRGFDLWPKTKWIWSFQLVLHAGCLHTKLHRGRSLYLSSEAARLIDPLVREAIAAADGDEAILLEHLGAHGESMKEDVELELGWDRRRLKSARTRLERMGALVSDGLVFVDQTNWHLAPLRRWDQVIEASQPAGDPHVEILAAGMNAAVVARESDLRSWFSWPIAAGAVDRLVESSRLMRPVPGWIAVAG